ncbi:MAG TPA: Xaa-Pro peptidase family protein, partial [Candidatus Sulfotelmatobacter sp.]|nr:Xaa-Pro peptidase family protein [Candidatus Sulfotelmatobacter sp.]
FGPVVVSAMRLTPRSELAARLVRLHARLAAENELDAVILMHPATLFYFAGTVQDAWMVIPRGGAPLLLVRKQIERAREESALDTIVPFATAREVPGLLRSHGLGGLSRIGLEFDLLSVERYVQIGRLLPTTQFADAARLVREVRMVKSPFEVDCIRRAAVIQDRMARRVTEVLRPGMSELELTAEVEAEARRHGHQGMIRTRRIEMDGLYGHLLTGPPGAAPAWPDTPTGGLGLSPAVNHGLCGRAIQPHEPVLLDYAGACDGYVSDQTRLFAIGGLPQPLVDAYAACRAVHEVVVAKLRPGVLAEEVYKTARAAAERLGYGGRFMNAGPAQVTYVGHGVGIELDEIPVLGHGRQTRLEPGMTLAVEPKIVCPSLGIVGLEDTVLVTDGDPEFLTFTPRDIRIV